MINNLHNKASRLRFIHDFDALYSLQKETSSHYVCINSYVVNFFAHRQSLFDCSTYHYRHLFLVLWPTCVHKHDFRLDFRGWNRRRAKRKSKFIKKYYHNKRWCCFVCFLIFIRHHCSLPVSVNFEYCMTRHAAIIIHSLPSLPTSTFMFLCFLLFLFSFLLEDYSLREMNICLCYISTFHFILVWLMGES